MPRGRPRKVVDETVGLRTGLDDDPLFPFETDPNADIRIDDDLRSLQDRIDAQAIYSKAVSGSVVVLTNQLGDACRTIDDLADRLSRLEMAVHGQAQQVDVQQRALERQTRFSAMQLAIQARGPGALADEVIGAAEAFLVWLRSGGMT